MPGTRDELPLPHFEDRLWGELEALHHERQRERAPATTVLVTDRRWRRRGPLLAAGATVAAAVAMAVMSIGLVPGSEPPAAGASIVAKVLAATDAAAGDSIIHSTTRQGEGTDFEEEWYDEVTSANRYRTLTADGRPLMDGGWPEPPSIDEVPEPGRMPPVTGFDECDPATGLAMDRRGALYPCDPGPVPPQPSHAWRTVNHCDRAYVDSSVPLVRQSGWGYITMFLETGHIVEDGTEDVGGRELIRLRNDDASYVFLVDPETYLPVQLTVRDGEGEAAVTTYERLARTTENLALLSPPVPDGFSSVAAEEPAPVDDGPVDISEEDDIPEGEVPMRPPPACSENPPEDPMGIILEPGEFEVTD